MSFFFDFLIFFLVPADFKDFCRVNWASLLGTTSSSVGGNRCYVGKIETASAIREARLDVIFAE